ncbi:MAG: dimethylarginine dimethylaminohydrolase family protein [Sideroxydans sp.]|nr:arginine deiminase-related protein [Sideroxyarcus sp.]
MQTFLMCEPTFFDVEYVINPWMEGNQGKVDKALAARQWNNLYEVLAQRASIRLIPPVAGLPDMTFTANGGFVSRHREVIVSSFRHRERQPEALHFKRFFEEANYRIVPIGKGLEFEGAGDALFDISGQVWMASGFRSNKAVESEIASALDVVTRGLTLVDPRWYHLDTAFCPLSHGEVIVYANAFSADSVAMIRHAFRDQAIWISDEDANNFACNAINVGDDVILHRASGALTGALREKGYHVIEVDVSEFMKSGGACKCLTLDLQDRRS